MTESELFVQIGGMSCVNCARGIENGLKKTAGVLAARVFLADESAEICFDADQISSAQIMQSITELGYEPRAGGAAPEEDTSRREIFLTAALALPTAVLAMVVDAGRLGIYLQMLFSGIILVTSGRRFFISGWQALKNRSPNMDVLVALGVGTSWAYSAIMVLHPHLAHDGMAHFEGAALLVLFILIGKGLESWARRLASGELRRLVDLQQRQVRVYDEKGEHMVPLEEVGVGRIIRVLPGERFPTDGVIVEGSSAVDESLLTGESLPVEKGVTSAVVSGSVNLQAPLLVKVTRDGAESTLQTLVRAVRRAQADKPPIQRFADRAAEWFVPVILGLSLLTGVGWVLAGAHVSQAVMHAVTVLVVACPCALGLATPTAVVVACGLAMKRGLLVRRPSALEAMARVQRLIVDKTGTITQGRPAVHAYHPYVAPLSDEQSSAVVELAGASNHPLSATIKSWVEGAFGRSIQKAGLSEVTEQRGLGMSGRDARGTSWYLGNSRHLIEHGLAVPPLPDEFEVQALTPVYLAHGETVLGVFGLRDEPRSEAIEVVRELKQLGITLVMASGDREAAVKAVAREIGIEAAHAALLPEQKLELVRECRQQGDVGFVGDGLNDAPSLAAATVGIAIGSGADAAKEHTDLVIAGHDLRVLPLAVRLSRATLAKIRQNLVWATVYNLAALPLASGILVPWLGPRWSLTPEIAGLAMALSSVSVVANSLLLRASFAEPPTSHAPK